MSRVQFSIALVCALAGASCAVTPYSGQQISTNTVKVEGLVDQPGVRVRVDAYDWNAARYLPMATVYSTTQLAFAAGTICPNSPPLYRYVASAALVWPIYWGDYDGSTYYAKVRATQLTAGETPLQFTANPHGVDCMIANAFNNTCDFYVVAYTTCGYNLTEARVKGTGGAPWN
jgi:hypothetical protein